MIQKNHSIKWLIFLKFSHRRQVIKIKIKKESMGGDVLCEFFSILFNFKISFLENFLDLCNEI